MNSMSELDNRVQDTWRFVVSELERQAKEYGNISEYCRMINLPRQVYYNYVCLGQGSQISAKRIYELAEKLGLDMAEIARRLSPSNLAGLHELIEKEPDLVAKFVEIMVGPVDRKEFLRQQLDYLSRKE